MKQTEKKDLLKNNRLIYGIIQYIDFKQIPGMLILIDFKKAFEIIFRDFIYQNLDYFNFGNEMNQCNFALYTDIKS